jgi:hypothetical protein
MKTNENKFYQKWSFLKLNALKMLKLPSLTHLIPEKCREIQKNAEKCKKCRKIQKIPIYLLCNSGM